jgi:hypothetical protein
LNTQHVEKNSASKSLVFVEKIDYDIIEDMKKNRENISLYELSKRKYQRNSLLRALGIYDKTSLSSTTT